MAKVQPFEDYPFQYEDWFEKNRFAYLSEIEAIKRKLPNSGNGIEIGVGSGRFAAPLGIKVGVEPAKRMREIAKSRGIIAIGGVAEFLPFSDCQFEFALMVTTVCFLDDIEAAFKEAYRVIRHGGQFIIGLVDKDSPVGRFYQKRKDKSAFYKIATFYSVDEVIYYLRKTGFEDFDFSQTIFHDLPAIKEIEPIKEGYGEGSFVVIRAKKV